MKRLINEFHSGHCANIYDFYGAHKVDGGIHFAVYAPNAKHVSVVGSFNEWNGFEHPMHREPDGTWICIIDRAQVGDAYKYRVTDAFGNNVDKGDPVGFFAECRPNTASKIANLDTYVWHDQAYIDQRDKHFDKPLNIYELHLGSWMRKPDGTWHTYQEVTSLLIPYLQEHGYTHVELMPLTEHPFDGSWGYQTNGYFSTTSRYGEPHELMGLVDALHGAHIGVLFDLVLAHFVKDAHGLAYFDGSPTYEYQAVIDAESEWGTLNFDLWKEEVRSFLISAGNFWIEKFHFDGLRIDAVSNIIYWGGNGSRGVNAGAVDFIKRFNYLMNHKNPGVILIAEDSSSFQGVTTPSEYGGLGFDYKWDLGWMNDTLKYYAKDPVYRHYHHNSLTFSMAYFYSERFLLPLSHDEVVHGKGSIINKMWGGYEEKFAQCKNLFVYMYTHPGKKLSFMGNELAQFREFDEHRELDFGLMQYPVHNQFNRMIKDLNHIYAYHPALSKFDYDNRGFHWIDANNASDCIYSYYRNSDDECLVVILNMTPRSFETYRVGVPENGRYVEILNSDRDIYGGYNMCNYNKVEAYEYHIHGCQFAIEVRIAPFAAQILKLEYRGEEEHV
ncbi:MAG: 1,4-alpha-glucan branching protein GlgB [Erysipelotrichaceae bacterium]